MEDLQDVCKRNRIVHDLSLCRVGATDRAFPNVELVPVDTGLGLNRVQFEIPQSPSGSVIGSQRCSGTDWPAQWYPHSSTHRLSSKREVMVASNATVAVCETGFASTR